MHISNKTILFIWEIFLINIVFPQVFVKLLIRKNSLAYLICTNTKLHVFKIDFFN